MKKRLLSWILFICLMMTMMPAVALAAEDVPDEMAPTVPVITQQPKSCDIVIGGTASFTVYAVGQGLTYQWYRQEKAESAVLPNPVELGENSSFGDYTYSGTQTHELKIRHHTDESAMPGTETGPDDALYFCRIIGKYGKAESDKVSLTLVTALAQTPKVEPGGNVSVFVGQTFSLHASASVSDGGTLSYAWSRGKASSFSASTLIGSTTADFTGIAPGEPDLWFYFCEVTNKKGGSTASAVVTFAVIVQSDGGSGGGGGAPPYEFPFTDVPLGAWYYFDVLIAHRDGYINGTTETTFSPNLNMTIAEAIKLAACMHQRYQTGDVTLQPSAYPLPWYKSYVDYAIGHDIIDSVGYIDYNEKIDRQEFVHIFYSALPQSEYAVINSVGEGAIPDVAMNDLYAEEIYTFYRAGILIGSDSLGTFKSTTNILRSEVAAILTRMFEETARKFITLL